MRSLTRRQRVAFTVLALVALALISLDVTGGRLRSLHGGAAGSLGALYRGTDSVVGPVRRFLAGIPSAGSAHDQVQRLEQQNAALRAQIHVADADQQSAAALRRLQLGADRGGYQIVPARVLALGPGGGFDWTVTLDVGATSGVKVDQTVTDGDSLVGRVLSVNARTSTVLLAADPGSGAGVRDTRSGQLAVATGTGTAGFEAVPLDPKADLRSGDEVRTGPAGSTSYVSDLAVGTITSVHASADGSVRATIRPALSPTSLDLVGVILVGGTEAPRAPLGPTASASTASIPQAAGR